MLKIKKKFVVDEDNETIGVILDIDTFQEIESLLEDHLLAKSIEEVADEKAVPIDEARNAVCQAKEKSMSWDILALPTFLKELARLPQSTRVQVEEFAFEILPTADDLSKLARLKS